MRIEGLETKERISSKGRRVVDFYEAGGSRRKCISLEVDEKGRAGVRYLEDGEQPGLQMGEFVFIQEYSDDVAERIVRAMAVLHMDVFDVDTAYTPTDLSMIENGFGIGIMWGENGRRPVWIKDTDGQKVRFIVGKSEDGGLPALKKDPAVLVCRKGENRVLQVQCSDIEDMFELLNTGAFEELVPSKGRAVLIREGDNGPLH